MCAAIRSQWPHGTFEHTKHKYSTVAVTNPIWLVYIRHLGWKRLIQVSAAHLTPSPVLAFTMKTYQMNSFEPSFLVAFVLAPCSYSTLLLNLELHPFSCSGEALWKREAVVRELVSICSIVCQWPGDMMTCMHATLRITCNTDRSDCDAHICSTDAAVIWTSSWSSWDVEQQPRTWIHDLIHADWRTAAQSHPDCFCLVATDKMMNWWRSSIFPHGPAQENNSRLLWQTQGH